MLSLGGPTLKKNVFFQFGERCFVTMDPDLEYWIRQNTIDLDLESYSLPNIVDQSQLIKDVTLDNLRIVMYTNPSPPSQKALDHPHLSRHLRTCMVIFKEEKAQACFYYFYRDIITSRNDSFKILKQTKLLQHKAKKYPITSEVERIKNSLSRIQSRLETDIAHIHIRLCNLERQLKKTSCKNGWNCTPEDITNYLQTINNSSKKIQ